MFAPMKMGFPTGMAGGGIAQFLQPLQEYLTQTVNSEKIQPFIDEISQLAQDRFDVDFGGGITNPGIGGGLFGGGMPLPDKGFDFSNPFPNMPPPLPPVQQPVMNTEPSGPVAGITNFGPDVGDGGLFSGGPMSGGTPMQLPGPRIPTFTGTGNDGFGSASQGPLDFYNPATGINEIPRPIGDIAQPTQPGYGGEIMQLPYDPTPMNPLIYDSLAAAGGLPDFAGSAQNYFNPGMGGQSAFGPMGARPEQMVELAQGRLTQQDKKPPEVQAYLDNIIQTGGRPTMMAPKIDGLDMGVQMPPGFTPLPPGELGFTENMIFPLQAYTGGSKTFNESAPNMLSPIFRS